MKFEEYNEDYGRDEFRSNLGGDLNKMTALQSMLLGEELDEKETSLIREFKCVKDFLDAPMNSPQEQHLKKMFVASIVTAMEKGVLPFELPDKSAVAIANIVDEGLTRLKVSYQTATGQLDPIEAVDALIDRTAARTATVLDRVIEKGMPVVLDKLCMTVARVYPPAACLVPVIKQMEPYITNATKQACRAGVNLVAQGAKSAVRKAVAGIKNVGRKVFNFLKA
ncbi:MAG: hypothetical protein Q4F85_14720 [Prevotella sp.]|nr:hypothetical protein [Prevotella sp.]